VKCISWQVLNPYEN
jgi:hypothetical protein